MPNEKLAAHRKEKLIKWMEKHKISQTDIATRVGVGRAYISLLFTPNRTFGEKAARRFEKALLMPGGYLDSEGDKEMAVDSWDKPGDLPAGVYALVPRVSIALSGGNGTVGFVEQALPPLAFREDWLRKKRVTSRSNLRVCEVSGNSMEPNIRDGDVVLVDIGQADLEEGEVYAIRYGEDVRIKRLFKRIDGGIRIHSDNPNFPEEVIGPGEGDQFAIIGKQIWRGG